MRHLLAGVTVTCGLAWAPAWGQGIGEDFETDAPGQPPINASFFLPTDQTAGGRTVVVDGGSVPAHPFPTGSQSLLVEDDSSASMTIIGFTGDLPSEGVSHGVFEVDFYPVADAASPNPFADFRLGFNGQASAMGTAQIGVWLRAFRLADGREFMQLRQGGKFTAFDVSNNFMRYNEGNHLVIEFSAGCFTMHLNGELLTAPDGQTTFAAENGLGRINHVNLVSGNSGHVGARYFVNHLRFETRASPPLPDAIAEEAMDTYYTMTGSYNMNRYADNPEGGTVGWGAGNIVMTYVSAYEATGFCFGLDGVAANADPIFANRSDRLGIGDDIRGKLMPAWVTERYTPGKQHAWLVHAGNFLGGVARWAYLVRKDPELESRFGDKATEYLAEADEVLKGFEAEDWIEGPGAGEGYFKGHPDYPDQPMPYNMMHAAGRAYIQMWLSTGDPHYRDRAEKMARFWKNRLVLTSGRYSWRYVSHQSRVEDISHGAISVDFAFQAHRAGIVFDDTDIARFIATFRNLIRTGTEWTPENPEAEYVIGFVKYVNGSGDLTYSSAAHRWLHLAYHDPELRELYYSWYERNWPDYSPLQMLHAAAYLAETAQPFAAELPIGAGETFDAWRSREFSEAELADPDISGPGADPDGIGVPNLLRYAFGIERGIKVNSGLGGIPTIARDGEGGLTFTYRRSTTATDIEYEVQFSRDLVDWQLREGLTEAVQEDGDWEEVTLQRKNSPDGRGFYRVLVRLQ